LGTREGKPGAKQLDLAKAPISIGNRASCRLALTASERLWRRKICRRIGRRRNVGGYFERVMPRVLILDWRVVRFMPRRAAGRRRAG